MSDNVVNLNDRRRERKDAPKVKVKPEHAPETDFEAQAAKNKANADRIAKERLNSNKGVLRSNRIKT
jgi:hypothetical protein